MCAIWNHLGRHERDGELAAHVSGLERVEPVRGLLQAVDALKRDPDLSGVGEFVRATEQRGVRRGGDVRRSHLFGGELLHLGDTQRNVRG